MQDGEWGEALHQLSEAADRIAVLARCLAVGSDLARWLAGEDLAGSLAADALDQARGDLERLSGGQAMAMLELVQRMLEELPVPLE